MLVSWRVIFETHSNLKHLVFFGPGGSFGVCWAPLWMPFASCRFEISCRRHGWNLHWEWRCWWRRQRILASRASMRRLGGHDPVQRIQFHLWVIWNLCFIKKTWARWYKTTVAYLLSTILRILLGFVTLRCGMLWVHPQKHVQIAHRATPSKYWFSRCSAFFGRESAKLTPPNFDFQVFVVKLNYQHLVFSVFFWLLLIEITNLLVTTLGKTIRHIIPSGFKHF